MQAISSKKAISPGHKDIHLKTLVIESTCGWWEPHGRQGNHAVLFVLGEKTISVERP